MKYRDFGRPPKIDDFFQFESIRRQCLADNGELEYKMQAELDSFFEVAQSEPEGMRELLQEMFSDKVEQVNNAEEFKRLHEKLHHFFIMSGALVNRAENYCERYKEQLDELKKPNAVCPCCGGKVSEKFIAELQADLDEAQKQADFYKKFSEAREKDLQNLDDRVKKTDWGEELWERRKRFYSTYIKNHGKSPFEEMQVYTA